MGSRQAGKRRRIGENRRNGLPAAQLRNRQKQHDLRQIVNQTPVKDNSLLDHRPVFYLERALK
jgi:hypothetical protein